MQFLHILYDLRDVSHVQIAHDAEHALLGLLRRCGLFHPDGRRQANNLQTTMQETASALKWSEFEPVSNLMFYAWSTSTVISGWESLNKQYQKSHIPERNSFEALPLFYVFSC